MKQRQYKMKRGIWTRSPTSTVRKLAKEITHMQTSVTVTSYGPNFLYF